MPGYRLTIAADDDLNAIFRAGIDLFGAAHADAYRAGLTAALAFLVNTPQVARLRSETQPPVRAWRYKAHLIVYTVEDEGILILRVRAGREDWLSDGK